MPIGRLREMGRWWWLLRHGIGMIRRDECGTTVEELDLVSFSEELDGFKKLCSSDAKEVEPVVTENTRVISEWRGVS